MFGFVLFGLAWMASNILNGWFSLALVGLVWMGSNSLNYCFVWLVLFGLYGLQQPKWLICCIFGLFWLLWPPMVFVLFGLVWFGLVWFKF